MNARSCNKTLNEQGFTLIELLVVISIIGLLASVVLVSLNGARVKARETKRRAELRQLATALELYYEQNGSYPSTSNTWWAESPDYGSHTSTGANGWIPNLAPTYVSVLPHDPLSGQNRTYFHPWCTAGETWYFYRSNGTDYKITNWCTVEQVVPTTDPFYDPSTTAGVAYAVYTPGARTW